MSLKKSQAFAHSFMLKLLMIIVVHIISSIFTITKPLYASFQLETPTPTATYDDIPPRDTPTLTVTPTPTVTLTITPTAPVTVSNPVSIPEPVTVILFGMGLTGFATFYATKRQNKNN